MKCFHKIIDFLNFGINFLILSLIHILICIHFMFKLMANEENILAKSHLVQVALNNIFMKSQQLHQLGTTQAIVTVIV